MRHLKDLSIGAVIGAANIIPGVSGGTMALIMGVYERLLTILSSISYRSVKSFLAILRFSREGRQQFVAEFQRLEGFFLIKLTIGALGAILSLASLMTYLLHQHHDATYGFFFGLVLLSAVYPYKLIRRRSPLLIVIVLLGAGSVFAVSTSVSDEALIEKAKQKQQLKQAKAAGTVVPEQRRVSTRLFVNIFILGFVAITAMVLPGISGSFLLLLLGGYFDILQAIATRDLLILSIFGIGCLAGLLVSSRLIHFLLSRWHDATMAYLLGLVLGSLWMIWPFKNSVKVGEQLVYLNNILPNGFGTNEMLTLATTLTGMATILAFLWIESRNSGNKQATAVD